jgi:hypothetical protein
MEIPEKCVKIMRTTVLAGLTALLSMSAAAADKQTQWEALRGLKSGDPV